ncbi:unnamed protein product, partial [marine sediment metagenome]
DWELLEVINSEIFNYNTIKILFQMKSIKSIIKIILYTNKLLFELI